MVTLTIISRHRIAAVLLLLTALVSSPLSLSAQNISDVLVVELLDGVETISLGRQPVISFEAGQLVVSTDEVNVTLNYGYDRIKRLYLTTQGEFSNTEPSGPVTAIDEPIQQPLQHRFIYVDGRVQIEGADADSKVLLFTADGRRLSAPVQYSNQQTMIDLSGLPAGLVIISLNGHSYKIMKK